MSDEENNTGDVVEDVAEGVGDAAETVGKIAEGDAAGALGSGLGAARGALGAAGGALGEGEAEAREALGAAESVAGAASSAVQAGQQLAGAAQSGDVGRGLGALGSASDAARYIVPEGEAREVLQGVGSVARGVGQAASALGGAASEHGGAEGDSTHGGGGDPRDPVRFHLEVQGADGHWSVARSSLDEQLNQVPVCFVEARYDGPLEAQELLHAEVSLFIERSESRREFRGVVWHAQVDERAHAEEVQVELQVMPRAALLGTRRDRKIFQDKTAMEVVEEVYGNMLGSFEQTVDTEGLTRTYETREYIVQYDETDLAFINRLCEEEGVFWFFDHQGNQPVLHLVDDAGGLPPAHGDDGVVDYHEHNQDGTPDFTSIWEVQHVEDVGSSDVVVAGYDWTNPTLDVRGEATGRSDVEPAREVYDPRTHALKYTQFNGTQYGANTATIQAKILAERLDLDRRHWTMSTSVVGARPGTLIELRGAPDADDDQRYLIVAVHAEGTATEDVSGVWQNTLEVVPITMPYRPPRTTPRPRTGGPTTAIVVGPSGEEIHTDEHGRVRVRFHWDRDHARGEETSSCWMRVSQSWAGPGFGTFFLPRVGMEVVVSYLEGDPDRPLVTGCVYHGQNRVGVQVPADRTQSLIRTKSSPQSEGFNELRFEDKAGSEFIYAHAQKDYNEEVEHCHSTHVKVDQSNTVDHDHTETVGNDQKLLVKGMREKTVENSETTEVQADRTETVFGNETLTLKSDRITEIKHNEKLTIGDDRTKLVKGREDQIVKKGREVIIKGGDDVLRVQDDKNRVTHVTGEYRIRSDKKYTLVQGSGLTEKVILDNDQVYVESSKKVHVVAHNTHILMNSNGEISMSAAQKISLEVGGTKLELTPSGVAIEGPDVQAKAGESVLKLAASGATLKGSNVDILADMFATVKAILARIN